MTFPQSYFDTDRLELYAGRFSIPNRFYALEYGPIVRTPAILSPDELRYIQQELTNAYMEEVFETYAKLTPFDAQFLVPRLPITVVMELLDMRKSQTASLKRLCNTLRDIPIEDYNMRVLHKIKNDVFNATLNHTFTFGNIPSKQDNSVYLEKLSKMKRFLNPKQCLKMSQAIGAEIHTIPKYLVKRFWSGPKFDMMYGKMLTTYKKPA